MRLRFIGIITSVTLITSIFAGVPANADTGQPTAGTGSNTKIDKTVIPTKKLTEAPLVQKLQLVSDQNANTLSNTI